MQVAFLGDIMPSGDRSGKQISVSSGLSEMLTSFDLRVATLETAVGDYSEIDEIKLPKSEVAVWSKVEDLQKLIDLNINVVSLANNHACDCGVEAMLRLLNTLRGLGITPLGAGHNEIEAMMPAVFEKNGKSLAIIGCCEDNPKSLGTLHFASKNSAGIYRLDEAVVIPQIRELKKQHTYVAVVVHWGVEHRWLPENYDVAIGKKLIDAGADVLIGGHPHHVQPKVTYKNHPIYYSLGNFHFPDFCLDKVSNVYYPSQIEFEKLPVFDWMAPERRNFPMRYFWKYYARLGMMASVAFCSGRVRASARFVLYRKGKVSHSLVGWWQALKLKMMVGLVGKDSSARINYLITRVRDIVEYKILGKFIRKYGFHEYMKTHNFEN